MERKEISDLESHSTWNIIDMKSLSEGENILSSTWAFNITEGDRSFNGLFQSPLYWCNMLKKTLIDNIIYNSPNLF